MTGAGPGSGDRAAGTSRPAADGGYDLPPGTGADPAAAAAGRARTRGARRSILVAEDNDAHRMVLSRVMHAIEAPFEIELSFVGSGGAMIETLRGMDRAARPDILLLDLHMPGMSGLETLEHLHGDEELKRIPVVILSSSDATHHIEQAYGAGANAYLVKRGDYAALREQMARFAAFWLGAAVTPGSASR